MRCTVTVRYGVVALTAALITSGCAGDGSSTSRASQESVVTQGKDLSGQPAPTGRTSAVTPAAETAVADLANRLNIDRARITVVSKEEVTWRDASLGCPRPGMSYPQVLVGGSRIVLAAGTTRYEYHARAGRAPFLCEHPRPPLRNGS